ncbi:MAG: phosphodiester glycosidase family protein [Okeania sp. SIO3B3]|nr:phosphodiester glycosidase family protein [Okeania sp. SIO3B3]
MQYVRIDLNVGAYVDNLFAGSYPKTFCWRAENHAKMGEPEGYVGFIAWSEFDPYLTEPADMTVVQRNRQTDTFNVFYNTVPPLAYRNRDFNGRIPIFVLNGSYFTPESAPEGTQARNGQFFRTDVNRTMLAISADGRRAEILWGDGSPVRYGEPRQLQYVVCEEDENGELYEPLRFAPGVDVSWIHTAIGGGPLFVLPDPNDLDANGNPRIKVSVAYSTDTTATTVPYNPLGESFGQPNSLYENNLDWEHRLDVYATRVPHTFVCTTSDNALIMGVSKRINGTELGQTLIQLGCTHAMALDDNSSSSFIWRGEYSRSLKIRDKFRYMGNAIGVYSQGGWTAPATQPIPHKSWAAEQLRSHNMNRLPSWVLLEQHFDQFGPNP